MILNSFPFELDKESIIQRNKEMYKHYNKLSLIKKRENLYLPKLDLFKKSPRQINNNSKSKSKSGNKGKNKNKNKNKSNQKIIKQIKPKNNLFLLFLQKDNEILNNKINEINTRPNMKTINEKIIKNLLKLQKHSRDNNRKIQLDTIIKTNNEMKNRIKNVHPMINSKALKLQYLESRKLYNLKRQLKPCLSLGNYFITPEDYICIEKYGNQQMDTNKSMCKTFSLKEIHKIKKLKNKKLGFSMSCRKINNK
jgi:hypothetical protein